MKPGAMKSRLRFKRLLGRAGLYFSVLVLISPAVLFFLWMLSLAFKNEADNTAFPPVFIPNPPTFDNVVDVFAKNDFLRYTINSVIVSFTATGLALLMGVPAGYGIAKAKASADPNRPGDTGPVLPDPAVPVVPMVGPDWHAGTFGDHASGDYSPHRGLDHDRLFRGSAGRTGR
jgi:hypothetical protein